MNYIKLIIKGFVVGLGKIIPGVSGGMLAIILGVYEDGIEAVAHFFSNIKKNIIFLGLLGIGAMVSIIFMSGVIDFSLEHYYLPTMLLFIGLMLGGFSSLKKEVVGTNYRDYMVYLIIPFVLMLMFNFSQRSSIFVYDGSIKSFGLLFLFGMIDAVTMVVPGISGTAVLMLLGCYTMLLETFSHALDFSLVSTSVGVLLPFVLGIVVGILITVKAVSYLLDKHSISFHYIIISFFLSSVFLLFLQTFQKNYSIVTVIIGMICFIVGYFVSKVLEIRYN